MHLLFADESGTPLPPNKVKVGELFVLGALIVPEDAWGTLAAGLAALKNKYAVEGELKWRYFYKKYGTLSHLSLQTQENLRTEIYSLINSNPAVTLLAVVVDQFSAYHQLNINGIHDLYSRAYKVLSERFQYYLQDVQRKTNQATRGMLILDNRGPHDDRLLQDFHMELGDGRHPFQSVYSNFVEGLFIAPSHHSVGIQLADMVGGAVYRNEVHSDPRFFEQIGERFRRSPSGRIEGFGLARVR